MSDYRIVLAAAIGVRHKQPMQDAGEDGALDAKLKTAAREPPTGRPAGSFPGRLSDADPKSVRR